MWFFLRSKVFFGGYTMDFRNEKAKKLKQGAIRAMFDRAATMTDVISMGIG